MLELAETTRPVLQAIYDLQFTGRPNADPKFLKNLAETESGEHDRECRRRRPDLGIKVPTQESLTREV